MLTGVCVCVSLELLLESELDAFRCATVEPIWQLREDLQYRLTEVQHQQQHQPPQPADWEKVLHQVRNNMVAAQNGTLFPMPGHYF